MRDTLTEKLTFATVSDWYTKTCGAWPSAEPVKQELIESYLRTKTTAKSFSLSSQVKPLSSIVSQLIRANQTDAPKGCSIISRSHSEWSADLLGKSFKVTRARIVERLAHEAALHFLVGDLASEGMKVLCGLDRDVIFIEMDNVGHLKEDPSNASLMLDRIYDEMRDLIESKDELESEEFHSKLDLLNRKAEELERKEAERFRKNAEQQRDAATEKVKGTIEAFDSIIAKYADDLARED